MLVEKPSATSLPIAIEWRTLQGSHSTPSSWCSNGGAEAASAPALTPIA